MSTRTSALAVVTALLLLVARPAAASCGFQVTVKNTGDVAFTVAKIKTANRAALIDLVYDTNWTGTQLIGAGKTHKFKFDVDSSCGNYHDVKLILQDGQACEEFKVSSGETIEIKKLDDCR